MLIWFLKSYLLFLLCLFLLHFLFFISLLLFLSILQIFRAFSKASFKSMNPTVFGNGSCDLTFPHAVGCTSIDPCWFSRNPDDPTKRSFNKNSLKECTLQSLTWNLKMAAWNRRFNLETIIFRFQPLNLGMVYLCKFYIRLLGLFLHLTLPETNSSPLKIDPWKFGDSYWKPPFLMAILVLGSFGNSECPFWSTFKRFPGVKSDFLHEQDIKLS